MGSVKEQYVCLHVPSFPAQARLRLRAEQMRKPIVILEGEPPLQTVCSITIAARKAGVAAGMTRTELDAFPDVIALPRSTVEENATRSAILQMTAAFTPRVEIVPEDDNFICVLDMTGTALIFGDIRTVLRRIDKAVRKLGIVPRLASSGNFHAAVCAAPFARKEPAVLAHGEEGPWLGRLPLSALKLTEEHAARLELWGVRTLAELGRLSETELVVRLGQTGKRLRELALGVHLHLMVPEEPSLTLEDALEFDSPEDRLEALLFVAGPMLDQLIARAQAHALSLAAVTFTLSLDGDGEHKRTLKPALPLADRNILLKLFNLDIQAHPPANAVVALRIQAEPGKRGQVQAGLFSPQLPEATRLDVTLAQIASMVGEGNVGSPRLLDTHRPDSFAMDRFVVPANSPSTGASKFTAMLRRVRPPILLRTWLNVDNGQPLSFAFEGKRYHVLSAFGPWRLSGEWWSQRVWSQEEWDVQARCGECLLLCVLTHDLLHHDWRLEALYD